MEETKAFKGLTVFILAAYEQNLLIETIDRIRKICSSDDILEIIIVLKSETCPSAETTDFLIENIHDFKIRKYVQKAPDIERCFGEIPDLCKSSHFIIMASDLETAPETLPSLISVSKDNPESIVCASKWHSGSDVEGYGKIKAFLNKSVNVYISCLYQKRVTDSFCFYQVYPMSVYNSFNITNKDELMYLYTLLALRTGKDYIEIPTVFRKRTEGKTGFSVLRLLFSGGLKFSVTALKIRLTPVSHLLK